MCGRSDSGSSGGYQAKAGGYSREYVALVIVLILMRLCTQASRMYFKDGQSTLNFALGISDIGGFINCSFLGCLMNFVNQATVIGNVKNVHKIC